MIKLGVFVLSILSTSEVVAQELTNEVYRYPPVQIAQGAGHTMGTPAATGGATSEREALIKNALSAAPPLVANTATVKDWDGTVLKQGDDNFTCFPTEASKRSKGENEPMCLDKVWLAWGDAWMNKKPFKAEKVGFAYMLAGDTGASNVDPFADKRTSDNQWIAEGPHIMVLVPDPAQLDVLPTDPYQGGPYVMWKGTPYAHIMVPVGARPAASR